MAYCKLENSETPECVNTAEASNLSTTFGAIDMNNIANKSLPVIAGVEILTDTEGRFNLNALHKASGLGAHKRPSQWLRRDDVKMLIAEFDSNSLKYNQSVNLHSAQISINVVNGGNNQGTFAHELLAISYAGWISPSFQLQVNQTFIDYRTGKLESVTIDLMQALDDPEMMLGILSTCTKKVLALQGKVEELRTDAEAFERIATKAEGSMCVTDAAKHLQVQPKSLFRTLSERHWIYKRTGGKNWRGYQDKIQQGCLEHKMTTVSRSDGSEKIVEQILVTAKGIAKLSKLLSVGVAA